MKVFAQICLIALPGTCALGALIDDPMFKYRCAERAFQQADYAVAQKFYGEIIADSPPVKLAAVLGLLDSMLCLGQWAFAEQYVNGMNFSQFEGLPGYDDLMLRLCFIFVKSRRFAGAESILAKINFAHLRNDMLPWYHLLNSLFLHDKRKFEEANVELDLARKCAQCEEQLQLINIFNLQNIVSEMGTNTDNDILENIFKKQISVYKDGPHEKNLVKLYALFLNNLGKRAEALNTVEECLQHIDNEEDTLLMQTYRAIVLGVLSKEGLADIGRILSGSCNMDTKLLAFKLLVGVVKTNEDATMVANFLDSIFAETDSDFVKRSILLAKIAISLNIERFDLCSAAASEYISLFAEDELFGDICELLAYTALEGKIFEYRNSAHYLDKLRVSMADGNVRTAITLKIADAFFYNHDFKLASDMYGEVLKLKPVEKCGHALVNQILSDIALNDYEGAAAHIDSVDGEAYGKFEAIVEYLRALKRNGMYDEALKYIDLLKLEGALISAKYNLGLFRAEILLKKKQNTQALVLASKICNELLGKFNSKEYTKICGKAFFMKGCAAYALSDPKTAAEAFKVLRTNFGETKYSSLSFFKEAKFLHKSGDTAGAISTLKLCTNVKYLPYANYEIALLKFHSGLIGDANELLEQITRENQGSEVATAARIAQGDILRAMGDFEDAQLIYEHGLSFVSNVRDTNYLSLVRAKCLIAQKNRGSQYLDTAANALENLYSSPGQNTSFRLECAAEYCLTLKLKGEYDKLKSFAFEVLTNVDAAGVKLTKKAQYWIFQILMILHDSVPYLQENDGKAIGELFEKYKMKFYD
ncbi:MAG: tetratricopeptide repeat protein [Puniceicoccales bacterium]|nr:tetratricopeptide repeat protein [Puniceicoccales bacterium]